VDRPSSLSAFRLSTRRVSTGEDRDVVIRFDEIEIETE